VIRYLLIALVAAIAYAALGIAVSHEPPRGIDLAGRAFSGEAPRLALIFTASCWWYVLVVLGIGAAILAVRSPAWRERALAAIVTTVVAWQTSDLLKNVFRRPRPDWWHVIHETSFSYSSGHAMFATIVYVLWAWYVWRSGLPRAIRFALPPLLVVWALGILWSRLALGAHYVSDLAGGVLLGSVMLALASAVRAALARRRAVARATG
jgi:membrane-associated phospholipid phosphatase